MKQQQTRELYAYWSELYSQGKIPERSLIEPMAIRKVLGDTFILEFTGSGKIIYRLAGTRLCAAFGAELKGRAFDAPWQDGEKNTIDTILRSSSEDGVAALMGCSATSKSGRSVFTETMILPLLHNGEKAGRLLGITTPTTRPYWLGMDPISDMTMTSLRIIDPSLASEPFNTKFKVVKTPPPALTASTARPVAIQGRRIRHLTIMDGGKPDFEEISNP